MTYPNWKEIAMGSISNINPTPVETTTVFTPLDDSDLATRLRTSIEQGSIVGIKNIEFAKSLLDGFERFGSFTDRQRPHVERMLVPSPDAALAQRLQEFIQQGETGYVAGLDFAKSLMAGYLQWGSFTYRQRPHVERLVATQEVSQNVTGKAPEAAPAVRTDDLATRVAPPVVAPPHAYTGLTGLVNLDKFARFTVGDLQLSLKNDGTVIWVKWQGVIGGSIDTFTGIFRPSHKYLSSVQHTEMMVELMRIDADPKGAAQEYGIRTGRCSCCGRPLTDPVSIGFGIGPVCRSRGWGL